MVCPIATSEWPLRGHPAPAFRPYTTPHRLGRSAHGTHPNALVAPAIRASSDSGKPRSISAGATNFRLAISLTIAYGTNPSRLIDPALRDHYSRIDVFLLNTYRPPLTVPSRC